MSRAGARSVMRRHELVWTHVGKTGRWIVSGDVIRTLDLQTGKTTDTPEMAGEEERQ